MNTTSNQAFIRGTSALESKNFQDALTFFYQVEAAEPNDTSVLINLGYALYQTGEYRKSIKFLMHAVENDSNNVDAHLWLGQSLQRTGQVDDALKELAIANKLDDSNPEVYSALGNFYLTQKRFGYAIDHYKKAVEYGGNSAKYRVGLAEVLCVIGKYQASLDILDEARASKIFTLDDEIDVLIMTGRVSSVMLKPNESMYYYQQALTLAPNDCKILSRIARLSRQSGNNIYAKELYSKALLLRPLWADAIYGLSLAEIGLNNLHDAMKHLEILVVQKPCHVAAHKVLIRLKIQTWNLRGAWHDLTYYVKRCIQE